MAGSLTAITVPLVRGAALHEACFVARPNRFLIEARLANGDLVAAHLADRGRLLTQLVPDARLLLGHMPGPARKTAYQVAGVYVGEHLVSLDTVLPNRLFEAAFRAQAVPHFAQMRHVEREISVGASRFDFGLGVSPAITPRAKRSEQCSTIVEIKSMGDVQDGLALFPDAPTSRGRRHLLELAELAQQGWRTAVVFAVQRADGWAAAINRQIDPAFAATLEAVAAQGVEVYAFRCPLTAAGIQLGEEIPMLLHDQKPTTRAVIH